MGTYFGDGSGGAYARYPSLRRCGVGVAKVSAAANDKIVFNFGIFLSLPGCVQTVPRSEAYALLAVLIHVTNGATVEFITDSDLLRKGFAAGSANAHLHKNSDIYHDIYQCIEEKSLSVTVLWMPSHSDDDPDKASKRPEWCTRYHVVGNKQADRLAEVAARYAI